MCAKVKTHCGVCLCYVGFFSVIPVPVELAAVETKNNSGRVVTIMLF